LPSAVPPRFRPPLWAAGTLRRDNGRTRVGLGRARGGCPCGFSPPTPRRPSAGSAAEGLHPVAFLLYQPRARLLLLFGVVHFAHSIALDGYAVNCDSPAGCSSVWGPACMPASGVWPCPHPQPRPQGVGAGGKGLGVWGGRFARPKPPSKGSPFAPQWEGGRGDGSHTCPERWSLACPQNELHPHPRCHCEEALGPTKQSPTRNDPSWGLLRSARNDNRERPPAGRAPPGAKPSTPGVGPGASGAQDPAATPGRSKFLCLAQGSRALGYSG